MAFPVHRPPLALRVLTALLAVAALLFNGLLMLSDRAPGALRRIGGAALHRLFERIDARERAAEVLADPRLPESDAIVHVAVWAVAVVLVGWTVWRWVGLLVGAAAVLGCSIAVELLQGRLTERRVVEVADMQANVVGVALGTAFVAVCYLLYSGLSILFRPRRRRR